MKGLREAARVLWGEGVAIRSMAGPTDERTIEACAAAGCRILRVLVPVVLDPAHCALAGEPTAIDIAWPWLSLVNLKSAMRARTSPADVVEAQGETRWTTAKDSAWSWRLGIEELRRRGYLGDFCLTGEYSAAPGHGELTGNDIVEPLRYDRAYLAYLMSEAPGQGTAFAPKGLGAVSRAAAAQRGGAAGPACRFPCSGWVDGLSGAVHTGGRRTTATPWSPLPSTGGAHSSTRPRPTRRAAARRLSAAS